MKKRLFIGLGIVLFCLCLQAAPDGKSSLIRQYSTVDGKPVPVTMAEEDDLLAPVDNNAAKAEAERLAAEQAAKEEAERLAAEQAAIEEAERLAAEQAAAASAAALVAAQAVQAETETAVAEPAQEAESAQEAEPAPEAELTPEAEPAPVIAEQVTPVVVDSLPAEQTTEPDAATFAAEQAAMIEAMRLAAEQEQADAERLAAEQAFEIERLSAEEEAEQERMAAEEKAEMERLAAERAERERMASEQAERERIAAMQLEEQERQRVDPEQYEIERMSAMSAKLEGKKVVPNEDEWNTSIFKRYYDYSGRSVLSIVSVGYSTYFLVGQESSISSGRDAFERHLIDLQLFEWRAKWFGMQLFNFEFGVNSEGKQVKNTNELRPLYYRGGEQPDELLPASGNTMWFAYKPAIKFFIPCTKWLAFEFYGGVELDLGKMWKSMSPSYYDDSSVPAQNFFFAPFGGIGFAFSGVAILPLEIKMEYRHPVKELGEGTSCNTAIIPQGIYLSVQVHLAAPIGKKKKTETD